MAVVPMIEVKRKQWAGKSKVPKAPPVIDIPVMDMEGDPMPARANAVLVEAPRERAIQRMESIFMSKLLSRDDR
ncbi:hypothetical protein IVB46_19395 [Bradyrhizobium sp. 61]|uniref:hypothetical protein n=1 Tax=unclassified Bradyrhizobium TaxID=2631580 RepID=UPI001FFBA4BF|nr:MULTISPECIES: hypothetical protein [unclassified Bradyrhizobium]MCK1277392.1 hypothetical protein [Bradyrhizobium sp. 61]MCK1447444.1 hypothetical protein [Bradyrhizobium sp. 48]